MKYEEDRLWQALGAMRIEAEGAAITFTEKLGRETGWTSAHAEAVMEEYRRFLYLAATEREPVSPSDAIDRVWHLHLTYSRHYWDVLCGEILGRPLHHDPNPGGAAEDERHADQYARTLEAYERVFGAPPPASIWPRPAAGPSRKGGMRPVAIGLGAAAGASLLLAACSGRSGERELMGWFPLIFVGMILLIIVIAFASRGQHKGKRGDSDGSCGAGGSGCGSSSSDSSSSDGGGSSCGGGGCGGGGGD
jgi:hypothetical protein